MLVDSGGMETVWCLHRLTPGVVAMRQTQAKIAVVTLEVLLHLALGVAFLVAVYTRFYSGLLPVVDLPNWPAYLAYFVVSFTLWSVLETKFAIIHNCIGAPSLLRWTWGLV